MVLGGGAAWVMCFISEVIREELSVQDNIKPVALLVMGYLAEDSKPYPGHFKLKPMEKTVSYNEF